KAQAAHVTPKIFYTVTSTEYWARAASLTHTTSDGAKDVGFSANSRLYFLPGTAHAIGPFPPIRGRNQHDINFAQQEWVDRALLLDLDEWIASGTAPPASRYPTLTRHELVPRESVRFPKIPDFPFASYMPQVWPMNYGPEFASKGIMSIQPPELGAPYTVLVPQVDADGNDLSGIRLPEVAAPMGTFTGWNISIPQMASLHYLDGLLGSFEAFPKDRAARERSGDGRKSITERYATRDDYLNRVRQAADELARQRFLREDDIPGVMTRAQSMWSFLVSDK